MQQTLQNLWREEKIHTVTCPHCGGEVPVRAKLGQGTQRGKRMKLNNNRRCILRMLNESKRPLHVREVQKMLVDKGIRRESKRHTGWNYHTVQADLSNLIGMGLVEMVKPHEIQQWNSDEGYTTKNVPHYKIKNVS